MTDQHGPSDAAPTRASLRAARHAENATTGPGRHRQPAAPRPLGERRRYRQSRGRHSAASSPSALRRAWLPLGATATIVAVGGSALAGVIPVPERGAKAALVADVDTSPAASRPADPAPRVARILPAAAHSAVATPARPAADATGSREKSETSRDRRTTWSCSVCSARITSGFGTRVSPGGIGSTRHEGVDFSMGIGTPLRAMHTGRVTSASAVSGLGYQVRIDYGGGVQVGYAHMSSIAVRTGQQVTRNQLVGRSGNTGNSTGPHLHLEVHLHGQPVDPKPWLRAHGML